MNKLALAIAASLLAAAPALAQEEGEGVPVTVDMDLSIVEGLHASLTPLFDQGQINMLRSVAHQRVVAAVCEGFAVDDARFHSEMNLIYYDTEGEQRDVTPEELAHIEQLAAYAFGVAVGNQRAIAAYDEAAYCAHADE